MTRGLVRREARSMESAMIWWKGLCSPHALVDAVRLGGLQVRIGELGREPVAQDLTASVGD